MIVKQLKVGMMENLCYILGCEQTGKGVVIDPGDDPEQILSEIQNPGLDIEYILNTHFHFDHTQCNQDVKESTNAYITMHMDDIPYYQAPVDIVLKSGDTIQCGEEINLQVLHTPGHTPGGICFYGDGRLFTGDTLFVGDSGRTDLPYSNRNSLGASIRELMKLPEETMIFPGHDYGATPTSTLREEKRNNVNAKEYGFYQP